MTGYENDEKKRDVLPIIKDKLTMAAKCVATSEDKSVGLPIGLNNRLKELYPFIIYAWKDKRITPRGFMCQKSALKICR